jgi:uncharacterized OB-fold protein
VNVVAPTAPPLDGALIGSDPEGPYLRGWRCGRCARLAFGARRICATCGSPEGRETRLAAAGRLETWTRVVGRSEYMIGYGLFGDGEDDQEVRVLGPLDVSDEGELEHGQALELRFRVGELAAGERLHHYFAPERGEGGER